MSRHVQGCQCSGCIQRIAIRQAHAEGLLDDAALKAQLQQVADKTLVAKGRKRIINARAKAKVKSVSVAYGVDGHLHQETLLEDGEAKYQSEPFQRAYGHPTAYKGSSTRMLSDDDQTVVATILATIPDEVIQAVLDCQDNHINAEGITYCDCTEAVAFRDTPLCDWLSMCYRAIL